MGAGLLGVFIRLVSVVRFQNDWKHLANIYSEGELEQKATVSKMETVQTEGGRTVRREIAFYNLDAIIAVGYRVNSKQAPSSANGRLPVRNAG
ncbi:RhuM family protein [Bifidobacterium sp. ESL0790]|uniref:RhuM family protein n=1 Tax=Bifidobacterium sp. ESL0790 TaxID=2983233 RepID=UPI0023F7BD57|nr:RhuM family protein [Bifidobacterium sp. ESL0790]WEV72205.1 RhuM family protein [Bifidobacterium sp. ESL0790]